RHGHADHTRGVLEEERDLLGRGRFRSHDEVALVLALLVVGDDHDLAAAHGRDRVFDPGERHRSLLHITHFGTSLTSAHHSLRHITHSGTSGSCWRSSRSTYLAITSTSTLTRPPRPF